MTNEFMVDADVLIGNVEHLNVFISWIRSKRTLEFTWTR